MLRKESMEWIDGKIRDSEAKQKNRLDLWAAQIEKRVTCMVEEEMKKKRVKLLEEVLKAVLHGHFCGAKNGEK